MGGVVGAQALVNQANGMAADLLDAADKRVPVLGLNARRKFFHGLAVVMFVPAIWIDVGTLSWHHQG